MHTHRANPRAFTLVELLCVISILTLLLVLLLPYLTAARDLALRAQCLVNERNLAAAILGFAAEHNGRAPGYGMSLTNDSPIDWTGVLNVEYYRVKDHSSGVYGLITYTVPKGVLSCPSFVIYNGHNWVYTYQMNSDVTGGDGILDGNFGYPSPCEFDGNFPHETPYGEVVNPSYVQPMYGPGTIVGWYNLGTRLMNFPRPDYTYMMTECDYPCMSSWGYINWPGQSPLTVVNANPNGSIANSSLAPWVAMVSTKNMYAFRHTRPPEYALYQAKATACFTYIDGHVDSQNANVPDQNAYSRLRLK